MDEVITCYVFIYGFEYLKKISYLHSCCYKEKNMKWNIDNLLLWSQATSWQKRTTSMWIFYFIISCTSMINKVIMILLRIHTHLHMHFTSKEHSQWITNIILKFIIPPGEQLTLCTLWTSILHEIYLSFNMRNKANTFYTIYRII